MYVSVTLLINLIQVESEIKEFLSEVTHKMLSIHTYKERKTRFFIQKQL